MKQFFRKIKLSPKNKEKLQQINDIIEEYQAIWEVLTLRQLYYQLVSRDIIPNQHKEYAKISLLLKEGRMWGLIDRDAIEDRVRKPSKPYSADSAQDAISDIIWQYRVDRMLWQDVYVEVWVEKDALSWVLSKVTRKYWINIMVNRGYSSASAMYDAYDRFKSAAQQGQSVRVLYLGDYDPSWIDMIRDIESRIREFDAWDEDWENIDFEIIPISLTKEQIKQYNPPPNPAKRKDPRAAGFIAEHGSSSREVDALKPEVLKKILEDNIQSLISMKQYNNMLEQEEKDKKELQKLASL